MIFSNDHRNGGMTQKQFELSNTLRSLWTEHVYWTRFFIVSTAFDLPDLQFVTQRLLQNPHDFAQLLLPLYGEEKAMKFEKLFTDHLLIAAALVNAAKANNSAELEKQRELWYANASEIVSFLAEINPYWNERVWHDLMFDHLHMTEDEAIQILTGKYEDSIKTFDDIQKEALEMADLMTVGIIKQFYS